MYMPEEKLIKTLLKLIDKSSEINNNLVKALTLLQEIREEYFMKFDNQNENGKFSILYRFPRYNIYSEMIDDYVTAAKRNADDLMEIQDQTYEYIKTA